MRTYTVLFICSGNSCRSQMAEALLRRHGGDRFEVHSCGLEAKEIHPMTLAVMQEVGIDLIANGHRAKDVSTYLGRLGVSYLISVCDIAEERCPAIWPGALHRLSWPFDDPPAFVGSESERLERFRAVRDAIERRILDWIAEF